MLGEPFKALLDGAVGASAVALVRAVKRHGPQAHAPISPAR